MSDTDKKANGNDPQHKQILQADRNKALLDAIMCCEDLHQLKAFLIDLCTPQELETLSERLVIARLLDVGGMSYRDISAATGASTTTVGRVARFLQQEPHQGYRLILERLKAKEGGRDDKQNNSTSAGT